MTPTSRITMHPALSMAVVCTTDNRPFEKRATTFAERLQLPLIPRLEWEKYDALLVYTEKGLQIQLKHDNKNRPGSILLVDFLSQSLRYRIKKGGGVKEALARAVGVKPGIRPSIIDATAGLGIDSFILASLGCAVTMIERSPLLAALLEDGLSRARLSLDIPEPVKNHLCLIQGDSQQIIQKVASKKKADTIYLDPMYPHTSKSALNKIEMRMIRILVGDDSDTATLLQSALQFAGKRVVVKRPKGAEHIHDERPSHVIKMKNSRFDVYML